MTFKLWNQPFEQPHIILFAYVSDQDNKINKNN